MEYKNFLENKSQIAGNHGFKPLFMPDYLFDFQKYLVEWSLIKGRGANFADCGLGKTIMQLVWAQNIVQKTNGNVLIITPLAVSQQTLKEAEKFSIDAKISQKEPYKITITNYEQLHNFDSKDFIGAVCDESSILKNFDGARKQQITIFMRKMKYRFLYTATAAPNDYIELGTSSEALGYLGHMDMLNKFFRNDQNNSATKRMHGKVAKWRFKGHSQDHFWKWVSGWAKACRMPSDLGFNDNGFVLKGKEEVEHIIKASRPLNGKLFQSPAIGLSEEREERKATITERCEKVAELVDTKEPAIVWCQYNDEGDILEKMIPDALQVAGRHSNNVKEDRLLGFANNEFRVLVTKPKIGAWGLNYQHCNHMTSFPSHSFEQYYQSVRRIYRFGQKRKVIIDVISTEGELNVLNNLQKKQAQAEKMYERLVYFMNESLIINNIKDFNKTEEIPTWLKNN